ncbi:MAG: alpha/beta hydrolase [Parvularculaceae bacterium]|nr:alpha/beta hydrolase [Parvularculaceae bacterium]
MVRLSYADESRRSWDGKSYRPISTTLWYEASSGATPEEIVIPANNPAFVGGWAARNATPTAGKRPLIVLSHGTGGSAFQLMWLARRLVAEGYIVAAVDHHGNSAAEGSFDARGFRLPAERAADISALIDALLADTVYGPLIDATRIGGAGFSLGGHTMMTLAGARTSFARFEKFCAGAQADTTCEPQSEFPSAWTEFDAMLEDDPVLRRRLAEQEGDFKDARIKSFVVIAPVLVQALTDESLARINAPIAVIAGGADVIAPSPTNSERLADKTFNVKLHTIPDAQHYSFLNECSPRAKRFLPICNDAGSERAALHDAAATMAIAHFNLTLASDDALR